MTSHSTDNRAALVEQAVRLALRELFVGSDPLPKGTTVSGHITDKVMQVLEYQDA